MELTEINDYLDNIDSKRKGPKAKGSKGDPESSDRSKIDFFQREPTNNKIYYNDTSSFEESAEEQIKVKPEQIQKKEKEPPKQLNIHDLKEAKKKAEAYLDNEYELEGHKFTEVELKQVIN